MKDIKNIASALAVGDVRRAFEIKNSVSSFNSVNNAEINEIVRQAVIGYLKAGEIYKAREAESLFKLPKEWLDDTIRQAVMSSFREGDMDTIVDLKHGLPIPEDMAKELIEYSASWGKPHFVERMREAFT